MNKTSLFLILVTQLSILLQSSSHSSEIKIATEFKRNFLRNKSLAMASWIKYGPLKINTSTLRQKKDNLIYQAYNGNSKPIYIAIDCQNKNINVTNKRLEWKGWEAPFKGFEFSILNDLCKLN